MAVAHIRKFEILHPPPVSGNQAAPRMEIHELTGSLDSLAGVGRSFLGVTVAAACAVSITAETSSLALRAVPNHPRTRYRRAFALQRRHLHKIDKRSKDRLTISSGAVSK